MRRPLGAALALASPGIRLSIADFYWLETVQYVGEPRGRERGFEKLLPLADLVTDLDPGHGYAYQTAGIVLSAEGRVDESDVILRKGMQPGRPGTIHRFDLDWRNGELAFEIGAIALATASVRAILRMTMSPRWPSVSSAMLILAINSVNPLGVVTWARRSLAATMRWPSSASAPA